MKSVKTILIILLTTATLAVATDSRLSLWFAYGRLGPYTLDTWDVWDIPLPEVMVGGGFDDGHIWVSTYELGELNYYYEIDTEGNIYSSFPAPESDDGQGKDIGVDVDDDYLWIICN